MFRFLFNDEQFLIPYIKCNGVFVDVGANFGSWTKFMLNKKYEVHAFDPSPKAIKILNCLRKQHSNLTVYPCALGETRKKAKLKLHSNCGHNSLVQEKNDFTNSTLEVEVRTLDSFKLKHVGFIKIDVEGYEIQVLKGAMNTIKKDKPRMIIEIHKPFKKHLKTITRMLNPLDYAFVVVYRYSFIKYAPYLIVGV